jgi:hypothetical protein
MSTVTNVVRTHPRILSSSRSSDGYSTLSRSPFLRFVALACGSHFTSSLWPSTSAHFWTRTTSALDSSTTPRSHPRFPSLISQRSIASLVESHCRAATRSSTGRAPSSAVGMPRMPAPRSRRRSSNAPTATFTHRSSTHPSSAGMGHVLAPACPPHAISPSTSLHILDHARRPRRLRQRAAENAHHGGRTRPRRYRAIRMNTSVAGHAGAPTRLRPGVLRPSPTSQR